MRSDVGGLDPCVLQHPRFPEYLAGLHTVPGLRQTEVLKLQVKLPSLDDQRVIGDTLYNLDRKIELNRRMNATLESLARAIFKSWFVDFDPVRAKMVECSRQCIWTMGERY